MVYISTNGEIICDYLNPKKLLDDIRLLCRGKSKPLPEVYERFNRETDDGRNMADMSELLSEAMKKEKQLNRKMELKAEIKRVKAFL